MNKKTYFMWAVAILLVIAIMVIAFLYISLKQSQRNEARIEQELEAKKQADIAAQQAMIVQKEKDIENQLKIIFPSRGSQLCFEEPYSISWQAPVDMDAVTVVLYTPTSSTRIGDYLAVSGTSNNVGFGSVQWDLTNAYGFVVPASQVYTMSISGMYHGHNISTSTVGVFSIGNCK